MLIRFSNAESTFTMTYRKLKEKDFTNIRLEKPNHFRDVPSLIVYVDSFAKKHKLEPTSYERKYQPLFDKHKPGKGPVPPTNHAYATSVLPGEKEEDKKDEKKKK